MSCPAYLAVSFWNCIPLLTGAGMGPWAWLMGDRCQPSPSVLSFLKEFYVFFIFLLLGIKSNPSFPPHFTSLCYDRRIICIVVTFLKLLLLKRFSHR